MRITIDPLIDTVGWLAFVLVLVGLMAACVGPQNGKPNVGTYAEPTECRR